MQWCLGKIHIGLAEEINRHVSANENRLIWIQSKRKFYFKLYHGKATFFIKNWCFFNRYAFLSWPGLVQKNIQVIFHKKNNVMYEDRTRCGAIKSLDELNSATLNSKLNLKKTHFIDVMMHKLRGFHNLDLRLRQLDDWRFLQEPGNHFLEPEDFFKILESRT